MELVLKSGNMQFNYYIIIIKTRLIHMFWYVSQRPSTYTYTYE